MKILNLDPKFYSKKALSLWQAMGEVDQREVDRRELLRIIPDYDAVILRLSHKIDKEVIARGTTLKLIATNTTGLDHIDLEAARDRNIAVISLRGEEQFLQTVTATAELTWGLLLSLIRHLPRASQSVLERRWDRDAFIGEELSGKTLGIIGLGRIGMQMATIAKAFRMHVLAHDPVRRETWVTHLPSLRELLPQCDVVSLHASLSPQTIRLLGEEEFWLFKQGAYFINTSRGDLVDEAALIEALSTGRIEGAAVDVISGEHADKSSHPLIVYAREHSNLLITPHLGGATRQSWENTEVFIAERAVRQLRALQEAASIP